MAKAQHSNISASASDRPLMIQKWPREPLYHRVQSARVLLLMQGVLTDGENTKVKARILARARKGLYVKQERSR